MNRTQIYLTEEQHNALRVMARRLRRTQSELIRAALDRYIARHLPANRLGLLRHGRGIWKGRCDLPDLKTLRQEFDRLS